MFFWETRSRIYGSREGVKVDPQRIQVITKWATPKKIKSFRGFLGPTEYYQKFGNN
jgi:hypothetical protein